jgi:flagellin-like protein
MKANRKFVEGDEGVSAVIGVILMVAITVAIAATVYVYVSGMIGGTTEKTPSISFTKSDAYNTLTVVAADTGLNWENVKVKSGANDFAYADSFGVSNTTIYAGDSLNNFNGTILVKIMWVPTNTLIGEWNFVA